MQKQQIIPIVRANEILIARLLDAGILYISEEDNMIHVKKTESRRSEEMERKIRKILVELGLKQYLPGFQYIIEVETLMFENRNRRLSEIYRIIGEEHSTTKESVYRAIKWVVDKMNPTTELYKEINETDKPVSIYMFVNSLYLYLWEDRKNED